MISGIQLSNKLLRGNGLIQSPNAGTLHCAVRELVPDIALCVLETIYMDIEFKGSFIKSLRVTSESYADSLGKLIDTVQRQIRGKEV